VTFRLHPLPAARAFVRAEFGADAVPAASGAVAAAANSSLTASAVELSRPSPGGPLLVSVLLEGSADGVAARARGMADLLAAAGAAGAVAEVSQTAPPWWPGTPGAPEALLAGDGTLVRVSFWVSALARVLDAIEAAGREAGIAPSVAGSAGAGVLYISCPPGEPGACAGFTAALRGALDHARGGVVVLAAPAEVRAALADRGGMAGSVPALSLMRAVKDQFDPGHRMSPGRFPEVI
jgi:glycolate oxidase FAD binding subunit